MKKAAICIFFSFVMAGCTPLERTAYNAVVGGKAALVSYRSHHPECSFDSKTGLSPAVKIDACTLNNRLTSAKDAIIDVAELYCSGTDFENGGACNPPSKSNPARAQLESKLRAAISSYNQIYKDVENAKSGGVE